LVAVSAAPHLPAGILSPYSDGERGAVVAAFANPSALQEKRRRCGQLLSPRHYTGRDVRQDSEGQHRRQRVANDFAGRWPADVDSYPRKNSRVYDLGSLLVLDMAG